MAGGGHCRSEQAAAGTNQEMPAIHAGIFTWSFHFWRSPRRKSTHELGTRRNYTLWEGKAGNEMLEKLVLGRVTGATPSTECGRWSVSQHIPHPRFRAGFGMTRLVSWLPKSRA